MKIIDIALHSMTRSFRTASALVFMFGIPLLVTGMFYFMFGNIASSSGFNLPKTKVVVANLDAGGPKFQTSTKNIPGSESARTMGELIVKILQTEDMAKLVQVSLVPSAQAARAAVDGQTAQVAIIIPANFSRQFADPDAQAVIEFYQDPTLTIGPSVVRSILNRFMDGMAGVKIAVDVFLDEATPNDYGLVNQVVYRYLDLSLVQTEDVAAAVLDVQTPSAKPKSDNPLLTIVGPIMAGMMVFYAFFTGANIAQSILKEEEERTLPRLFTTPTPQAVILGGKFLAVFLTVLVQVVTLIFAAKFIFGIDWGAPTAIALAAVGLVPVAASFGIMLNSFMKSTKQGATVFGGILTTTGILGMISIMATGTPAAEQLANSVSLVVPQGWGNRAILQAMHGAAIQDIAVSMVVMLGLSVLFFVVGVWRFNRRYA